MANYESKASKNGQYEGHKTCCKIGCNGSYMFLWGTWSLCKEEITKKHVAGL